MQGRIAVALVLFSSGVLAQPVPAPSATTAPAPLVTPAPAPAPAPAPTPAPAPPAQPQPQYPPQYPPQYGYPYPYAPPPYYAPTPPAVLPYSDGDPIPPGYHTESRVRRGPIIFGASMGGATYLVNILVAAAAERSGDDRATYLYIPGIGTWAYVNDACDDDRDGCQIVVLHSLAHSVGIALIVYGLAAPRTVLARDTASLRLTPLVGPRLSGIAASGTF